MDVISDTKGMDFRPYLAKVLPMIKANWYTRIPVSARPPILRIVVVVFKVMKDGTVSEVRYTKQSGDYTLDSAAYNGVVSSSPLPALPKDFGCSFAEVRIQFLYNPGGTDGSTSDNENSAPSIPCVTTTIHTVGEIGIALSPNSSRVIAGGKQQFVATVIGVDNPGITWKVSGPGCTGIACGEISADGVYRAPSDIPNPATVAVTASLKGAPDESAFATVTIVPTTTSH